MSNELSMKGSFYHWKLPASDVNAAYLAVDLNLTQAVASVLINRGFSDKNKAQEFLFYSYDEEKHHPKFLHNADKAVGRIIKAIEQKEKILISGDYDVDGITSTSLMMLGLLNCGAVVNFYLPHRVKDGYGLSKSIVEKAYKNGYQVIITVDNGITAHEAILYAFEKGIDIIVTDHHQPSEFLPEGAFAIVNPHQKTCQYPFKELAGVGVAFKIVQLLYETLNKKLPDQIYELFLLGTVADVVPLKEENRYWVQVALQRVKSRGTSQALSILKQNARIDPEKNLSSEDIGFSIAPQLNALGRLEDPRQGVSFLLSSEQEALVVLGKYLYELNEQRKLLERKVFEEIRIYLDKNKEKISNDGCVVYHHQDCPIGLLGLVAARLMHYYGVPVCLFGGTEKGLLKGSCRSISECNIFDCLRSLPEGLLKNFGGHAHAAGISLEEKNFNQFQVLFAEQVRLGCKPEDRVPKIYLDAYLDLEDLNEKLWQDLELLEPFGAHNSQPLFCIKKVFVHEEPLLIKEKHVKCKISVGKQVGTVIFFNRPDLYIILKDNILKQCAVAARVSCNIWKQKKSIELIGLDIAFF